MYETCSKMSSADVSPVTTPSSTPLSGGHPPKFGTVIPSRIFVGGIAANTTDAELKQYFSAFGAVKDTKIITDRAGVSKGYGFVTFESQEDADRIIKKESDNLIFKDRKLNIGPAVRKQGLPRPYDASIPPGSVLFTNGVPYTYQNGMAIFQTPDGNYPLAQPQSYATTAVMIPQNQVYMTPQYPYQQLSLQSSLQPVPANPGYIWATMPTAADVLYQTPQAYQGAELADATFVDGTTVETSRYAGNVIPVEQTLANRIHSPVTEVNCTSDQTSVATVPVIPVQAAAKNAVAGYKKHYALTRRSFSSPTILVKHGHKVQRLMVSGTSPPTMYNGQILNPCNPSDTGDGSDAYIRYTHLPGHSTTK
ncbi:protein boule-like isoform X2 [Physella acuta]|uniref:protein boule-like isoform X2 n=1 Tax=Physella acuta TaxID=109671 RepID=UPI0027DB4632|nr:protein boule-like isoform X2 [Physella acuta]